MTFTIVLVLMSIVSNSAWADSKKLTITLEKPAESLDPAKALSVEAQFIASQVYENLFLTGYDGTILPGLATHWETSSDRRTLTIQLDPDSKFSNGVPVTTRHVRNMIEDTVRTGSFRGLDRILGVQPFKQKATQHIAGVQVLGEFQLKIQLEKPYSRFLQEFSDRSSRPQSLLTTGKKSTWFLWLKIITALQI